MVNIIFVMLTFLVKMIQIMKIMLTIFMKKVHIISIMLTINMQKSSHYMHNVDRLTNHNVLSTTKTVLKNHDTMEDIAELG